MEPFRPGGDEVNGDAGGFSGDEGRQSSDEVAADGRILRPAAGSGHGRRSAWEVEGPRRGVTARGGWGSRSPGLVADDDPQAAGQATTADARGGEVEAPGRSGSARGLVASGGEERTATGIRQGVRRR